MWFFKLISCLIVFVTLFASICFTSEDRCRIFEFRCANTKCIPLPLKCNGIDNCGDGSDEICDNTNMFECDDNKLISKDNLCDGIKHCSNDEEQKICEESKCSKDHFLCRTKPMKCIDINAVCNTIKDCADESDESPDACEYMRNSKIVECNNATQFRCVDKHLCVSKVFHCDGNYDCEDKSDEDGCLDSSTKTKSADKNNILKYDFNKTNCPADDFDCGEGASGKCIPKDWVCDGSFDCDGSNEDEKNCENFKCPPFKPRKCKSNDICYVNEMHCDGVLNCPDSSDEFNCTTEINSVECDPLREIKCFKKNICIPLSKVCDNVDDCGDRSDERPGGDQENCQKTPCKLNNGGCEQECVSLYSERKCFCRPGYMISSANTSRCVDIDECANSAACSHICKNNQGSYECECFDGFYKSKINSSQCVAVGEKFLLFSSINSIRELRLLHHHVEELAGSNGKNQKFQVIGLDFDYKAGDIFWTQYEPQPAIVKIKYKSSVNLNPIKTYLINTRIHSPIGLAFDWVHGLLFWTDSFYKEISVLNVTSGHRRVLLKLSNDSKLQSIAVHPKYRRIYWTDWGNKPCIMSMGMDGQDIKTLIDEGLVTPNGLAMDYYLNELYWVDARAKNINSYNLKSGKKRVVVTHLNAHGFSLDVFEDFLYLTDWHNQNILQIHKITGQQKILISTPKPVGLKLMHQLAQPENINNACSDSPCQNFCLPSALNIKNEVKFRCQCPDGSFLLSDNISCFSVQNEVLKQSMFQKVESVGRISKKNVIPKTNIYFIVSSVSVIVAIVLSLVVFVGIVMYRNYLRKVIKRATNFNNPIYFRKPSNHDLQVLNPDILGDHINGDNCSSGLLINSTDECIQMNE